MPNDHGIDYGMGTTNVDRDTGIRFGVINMNALNEWAWESVEADYGPPTCGHCGCEVDEWDSEKHDAYVGGGSDYACEGCELCFVADECYGDEPIGHTLDDGDYQGTVDSSSDLFLTKSPYYTHAQFCSPCAPGACYLEHPTGTSGPKAYCLGHDWFEGGRAAYTVYRVADGSVVPPDSK